MARAFLLACIAASFANAHNLPSTLDLRNLNGKSYVSTVKSQSGGTCWTHGAIAAVESNLMLTGTWGTSGESGEAALAEYHLDWWNGFNKHFNKDIAPTSGGLTVHQGGDYRVAAAYFSRGGGAVRDVDGQSYNSPPKETNTGFKFFYTRDIEWFSAGPNLERIEKIKRAIQEHGVIGTALAWSSSFYSGNTFYQPTSSSSEANHAVAIIGWDDNKTTQASKPGAWLVKNSWGTGWGSNGYFWISYYDKVAGQHPEMGAVAFKNTEKLRYDSIYSHDYHGWRATKQATEGFNAFQAAGNETVESVSFYTTTDNVEYSVKLFGRFENGELSDQLSVKEGVIENTGFHTVDLNFPARVDAGKDFYVYLSVSGGGLAFDKTSNVPVLLGGSGRPIVESRASPGQSFYRSGNAWVDLTKDDSTANLCIKALAVTQ